MSIYQFWEEICAFTVLCIVFVFLKVYICCSGLGLGQNHKQPAVRSGLNAKTSLNCQETGRIILRANQKFALKNTYVQESNCLVENPAEEVIPLKQVRFKKQRAQIHAVKTHADPSV
jgi:hypothetical protein